jgi:isocitrate/isopropylmalate dehydrogenase
MRLAVLPGDGIGPEICSAAVSVLERLDARFGLRLELSEWIIGLDALETRGTTAPAEALAACVDADGIILGPISHADYPPVMDGGINVSAALRVSLDLYANIRPSKTPAGLRADAPPVDLVIVRENTEGFYADRNMYLGSGELMPTPDVALAIRKITARGSRRIAEAAFEIAARRRARLTVVHKANVLRISDGLFLDEVRKVALRYPDVGCQEQLVDSMAALLVRDPTAFDVILATNMFGDILSDLTAELAGGLGLGGSINRGDSHCLAQAQHGSAPALAGTDSANPCALLSSVAMLLEWYAARESGREAFAAAAKAVEAALNQMLMHPETRTRDLGGPLGTRAFSAGVCALV